MRRCKTAVGGHWQLGLLAVLLQVSWQSSLPPPAPPTGLLSNTHTLPITPLLPAPPPFCQPERREFRRRANPAAPRPPLQHRCGMSSPCLPLLHSPHLKTPLPHPRSHPSAPHLNTPPPPPPLPSPASPPPDLPPHRRLRLVPGRRDPPAQTLPGVERRGGGEVSGWWSTAPDGATDSTNVAWRAAERGGFERVDARLGRSGDPVPPPSPGGALAAKRL